MEVIFHNYQCSHRDMKVTVNVRKTTKEEKREAMIALGLLVITIIIIKKVLF